MKSKSNKTKGCDIELSLGDRRSNHIADMQNIERDLGNVWSAQKKKNLQIVISNS